MPVNHVNITPGTPFEIDRAEVFVSRPQEILAAPGQIGASPRFQDILLDTTAVDGAEDDTILEALRKMGHIQTDQTRMGPTALFMEGVIANFPQIAEDVGVIAGTGLPLINPSRNDVVQG